VTYKTSDIPPVESISILDATPVKKGRKTFYTPMLRLKSGQNWFFPEKEILLANEAAAIAFGQAYVLGFHAGKASR